MRAGRGLLVGVLFLAACTTGTPDDERASAASEAGARLVLAVEDGVDALAQDPELAARVCGVLRQRLSAADLTAEVFLDGSRVVVTFDSSPTPGERAVASTALTLAGRFSCAIVADEGDPSTFEAPRHPWARGGAEGDPVRLVVPSDSSVTFTTEDLAEAHPSADNRGAPAVGFGLRRERRSDFGDFTAAHEGRQLAWLLDGAVVAMPVLLDRLPGRGILVGEFSREQARGIAAALEGGELPVPLELVSAD